MKERYRRIILPLLVFVILFIIIEVCSRYILYKHTPPDLIFDKDLIYRCKPYGSSWGQTLNDIGCIGPDVRESKLPNEIRIFLLGGSTSFSKDAVDAMTDGLSDAYSHDTFKVVSCSKPRYTSYTNLVNLQQNLLQYAPDIIVCYMAINDCIYNSFPWVGQLPDIGFWNYKALNESIFFSLLKYHIIDKRLRIKPHWSGEVLRSTSFFNDNLRGIINTALANDITVVLSTFALSYPTDDSVLLKTIRSEENRMQHFWGTIDSTVYGVEKHNEIIIDCAAEYGIPLVQMHNNTIPADSRYFIDMCHFTKEGHKQFATRMSHAIQQVLSNKK
ncbi:MAG: hypothetical protein KKH94_11000 [Candidatus Omnitrophica bacterium]|nr:hypothetical protein [Candidatus Omnitrophota bacterium]